MKKLRILLGLTQQELAVRSGIGVATLHRFEKTGTLSLENALRVSLALGAEKGFESLFSLPAYASLDEALARPKERVRVRRRA